MNTGEESAEMETNKASVSKIKHEWYQTDAYVIVTVLAKETKNVKISYGENTLSASAKLPSGNEYSLELDLAYPIVPEQCSHKVLVSKIEIKLKKQDGIRWMELEGSPTPEQDKTRFIPNEVLQATKQPPRYPSSSKKYTDWNKMEKEITKEEATEVLEGEAAINDLLQKIYGSGSDEVRRAMNKSYVESEGTVLSTNWNEVKLKTVEKKPPTGMEWKSWTS